MMYFGCSDMMYAEKNGIRQVGLIRLLIGHQIEMFMREIDQCAQNLTILNSIVNILLGTYVIM